MSPKVTGWDELHLAENPAGELLQSLGYTCVTPEALEPERTNFKEPILTNHLAVALKRLNPWLSDTNLARTVKAVTQVPAASLAANMRQALPNACFLGFTGTPIDKKDRSTLRTFGPYIDTYTIEQAVQDGATVPIFYEGRLPELQIIGQTIDQVFDRVFADRTEDERAVIKQRFATEQAIAGAPRRIEAICLDLIDHFTRFIAPNGFKAQVVAANRDLASLIDEEVAPFTELVDWWQKDDLQRQMRSKIKRQLRASGIEAEAVESLAADIVDLAKVRTDR